jgi:prophage maintenance system killer protein
MKKQVKEKDSTLPVVTFTAKHGVIELKGDVSNRTVWATQQHIAEVFNVDRSVVTKHIRNILADKELDTNAVCAKFAHTAGDGKTYEVQFYALDIVLAVGYRTNSAVAIDFRKWATKTLRTHIVDGYTINPKRISQNYTAFMDAVSRIQHLLPEHVTLDPKGVLELVKEFAATWVSLDSYDKETLTKIGTTKKSTTLTATELTAAIVQLRSELLRKGEATELFAQDRTKDSVGSIVGSVMQSFGGKPVYETVEEKAAHLLYFMVKNHPFVDGNKRSGAFAFVWFLRKAKAKFAKNINPAALTALTLLIAESNPAKKDQMVALVVTLLRGKV